LLPPVSMTCREGPAVQIGPDCSESTPLCSWCLNDKQN